MKSVDPILRALDDEYEAALAARQAADAALADVAARREAAYVASERERSTMEQHLRNMSDAEWAALKQRIEVTRGPKVDAQPHAPGV